MTRILRCSVFCTVVIALSAISGVSFAQIAPAITSASASFSDGVVTVDFASNGDFDRRQIMIDIDNNVNTGFTSGYDYLLENGYLYSYTGDGASWSWDSFGSVSGSTGVQAFEQTVQWVFTLAAPPDTPVRFYIENDSLGASDALISTISGSSVDPADAPVIASASANYSAGAVTVDLSSSGDSSRRLVMIDADINASTGYSGGYDYLLENGNLYNYTGDGANWSWSSFGSVTGSTGDQAFDLSAQWVFSIPDLSANAPVRFYIENDSLNASDEIFSTVTGDNLPGSSSFRPQDNSEIFANPERGLYKYSVISINKDHKNEDGFPLPQYTDDHEYCWNGNCGASDDDLREELNGNYAQNYSLLWIKVEMPNEVNSENLPEGLLAEIARVLRLASEAGLKVIFRGVYRPSGEFNGSEFCPSTPQVDLQALSRYEPSNINTVKTHISQLAGVLNNNPGALAYVEAGMVGAWGEWNCSTLYRNPQTGAIEDTLETRSLLVPAVVGTWLQELSRGFIAVRTPRLKFDNYSTGAGSRVSFYNDCFLKNETHAGTYEFTSAIGSIEQQRDYVQQQTQSVPIGGENCGWDVDYNAAQSNDIHAPSAALGNFCEKGRQALRDYRFTYLNNRDDVSWITNWIAEGCWGDVQKELGYRFDLEEVKLSGTLSPGNNLTVELKVANNGYARLYKERDVELVFSRTDNSFSESVVLSGIDPTSWLPGIISNQSATISIPTSIPSGSYELGVRLPDRDNPANPRQAIRFANSGWSAQSGVQVFTSGAVIILGDDFGGAAIRKLNDDQLFVATTASKSDGNTVVDGSSGGSGGGSAGLLWLMLFWLYWLRAAFLQHQRWF